MFITTTGTIVAQLTRLGRQILADNSANFKISQYKFSDDEINYADFNGNALDAPNGTILNTPILESNTFGKIPSQRYNIFTKPLNTLQIARMDVSIGRPFVDGTQDFRPERSQVFLILNSDVYNTSNPYRFTVRTLHGYDNQYLLAANNFLVGGGEQTIPVQSGTLVGSVNTTIVLPFGPNPDVVPCSDPFEILQNQSQAEIQIMLSIKPDDFILGNFALEHLQLFVDNFDLGKDLNLTLSKSFTEQQIITAWFAWLNQRISLGISQVATLSSNEPLQFIDQYKEVGIAVSDISIRGNNTGKLFTIKILIYSGSILSNILRTVLESPQGDAIITPPILKITGNQRKEIF
jgi:hypothetical protein